jgi:hypothetical protein
MTTQRFRAVIVQDGGRLLIPIPFNPDEVWGEKPRHHVRGSVDAHMVRGPLSIEGSRASLPLGAAWLRGTDLEVDAEVEVVLEPEGPQTDELPADVSAALDADPEARAFFAGLATFYRKRYLKWIEGARRPEVRLERIGEVVELLKAGKKQK